jgi:hypothetical protein
MALASARSPIEAAAAAEIWGVFVLMADLLRSG